ncbi:MAG: exodeoxyribonuclease VII large subunit [Alteromonadaceae bacterium]|nr:exodeoxyribonuclease VII large subunit [Alteromonadaceae bacterium]
MSQQHILQVSELTKKVRFILESELNTVWLCGEISNFICAGSGHWYLSLKDSKSQVRCAMFKGNNRRVRLSANSSQNSLRGSGTFSSSLPSSVPSSLPSSLPRNGQQVLVRAKVSLYEPRGDFQLIIEQMEDAGEGLLKQQYEQLKNKLNIEGLFSAHTKQTIPEHVRCVGIVTSPTGAAVKDILTVLKRRNPSIKAIIYPALVQGEYAAADITHAINQANLRKECDVLIIGRGGGSLEDLWSFNEESVVRAIYHSNLPTISAVGHEIDTTLADYCADLRAATPSAAAELVSQDNSELLSRISVLKQRTFNAFKRKIAENNQQHLALQHRLTRVHPAQQLQVQQQKADQLNLRLTQAIQRKHQSLSIKPKQLNKHLLSLSPLKRIEQQTQCIKNNELRLKNALNNSFQLKKEKFVHVIEQLHLISPLATIARGYSITRDSNNKVIRKVNEVAIGDELTIQVNDGHIVSQVKNIQ